MNEVNINKIIRSRRKTIALYILKDSSLVIKAPLNVSLIYLQDLVNSKREWIERKQRYFAEKTKDESPKRFINGEEFLFQGKLYKLEIAESSSKKVWLDEKLNLSSACFPKEKEYLTKWYINEARKFITDRVKYFSVLHGFNFKTISINSAKSRWGSCGPKNTLNFSWRLVMAPPEMIDYVVVHELVHTVIKNHSRNFYNKLGLTLPDYRIREKWLKDNSAFLNI